MQERGIQIRICIVAAALFVSLCGLGGRLAYLHLGNHSKIKREFTRELLGLRGRIFDCNGEQFPMAVSLPARQYFLDPQSVKKEHDADYIAKTVSEALGLDEKDVQAKLKQTDSRYIKLGISLNDQAFAKLSDPKHISGIGAEELVVRSYPQGRRMAHVLGFVNSQAAGAGGGAGVEQTFNRYLKGTPGQITSEMDAGRTEIWSRRKVDVPPIPGSDVHLTLDHNIQYEVEQDLKEVVEKFQALSGWAIVERVKTGAILAMASYPDFDPEHYSEESSDVWRNNALAVVYEPGSIMKSVTVASAINEHLVSPDTMIDVGDGTWSYAGKPLHDHVTGCISVSTALKKSSNIACAKIGLMFKPQRLESYLRAFNFGDRLGIELPGEERGILARCKDWSKLTPTRVPIGQGIAVTGLQMISAYSALANDGMMMRPYVVEKVVSANGEVIYRAKSEVIGRPVRPEVARAVREMLVGVTEEGGTGKRATVPGYSVGGKTGTAQKAVPGGYSSTDYYASFVGFVPAHDPVFAVLVSVERPRPQHTGGFVSAPVFSKIAAVTARYLEIPPDEPLETDDDSESGQP